MAKDQSAGFYTDDVLSSIALPKNAAVILRFSAAGPIEAKATSLLDIISNSIVLRQLAPYLPVASLYALAGTSKRLNELLMTSPDTFRFLDLSPVKSAQLDFGAIDFGGINWRAERMDEALTEDEFYAGPLRGILSRPSRRHIFSTVSTMLLDGLAVPAEIVREIILEDRFNVRILSIREAKHLNERKLMQVLNYAVRPTRPRGTPRLKGLYVFGPMDPPQRPPEPVVGRRRSPTRYPGSRSSGVLNLLGVQLGAEWNKRSQEALNSQLAFAEDKWWQPTGRMFKKTPFPDWADTMKACEGIIHFDAVLCRGPRHGPPSGIAADEDDFYLPPAVATIALGPRGCSKCRSSPEKPAHLGESPPEHMPLLAPPPTHSYSIRAAQMPSVAITQSPFLIVRCAQCLRGRWCERCQKWWCEECYEPPTTLTQLQRQELSQIPGWVDSDGGRRPKEMSIKMGSKRECFGCGETCAECKDLFIRACRVCRAEYCVIDNDGSSAQACDWCNYSGRRTREL